MANSWLRRKVNPTLLGFIPPLSNTIVLCEGGVSIAITQTDTVTPLVHISGLWKHLLDWSPKSTYWELPLRYSAMPFFPATNPGFPLVVPSTKPWRMSPVKTSIGNTTSAAEKLYRWTFACYWANIMSWRWLDYNVLMRIHNSERVNSSGHEGGPVLLPDSKTRCSKTGTPLWADPCANCYLMGSRWCQLISPGQNGRHFADNSVKRIFLMKKFEFFIKIALKFVPKGPIVNNQALGSIMAWRRIGDKPLSEHSVSWAIQGYIDSNNLKPMMNSDHIEQLTATANRFMTMPLTITWHHFALLETIKIFRWYCSNVTW